MVYTNINILSIKNTVNYLILHQQATDGIVALEVVMKITANALHLL